MAKASAMIAVLMLLAGLVGMPQAAPSEPAPSLREGLERLAESGNAQARYQLGMLHSLGMAGLAVDQRRAYALFAEAAAQGDPLGAYKQGCYLVGQHPGTVPLDQERGLALKLQAAEAGYDLAQLDVAQTYLQQRDFAVAQRWLDAAAAQGDARSLFNLSVGWLRGDWGSIDKARGYAYFKLAKLQAEKKINARAQASLDELAAGMTPQDLDAAEQLVAGWHARPTALTLQARAGLAHGRKLAGERARLP